MSLERTVVWAAALLAAVAPLLIGGAHPWTQVGLSAGALLVAGAALYVHRERGLKLVPFAAAAALATGFTLLQLVPLPTGLAQLVSPAAMTVRAESVGSAPAFMPLTLDVPATTLEVVKFLAYLGLLRCAARTACC
jgi:hypothetical protein